MSPGTTQPSIAGKLQGPTLQDLELLYVGAGGLELGEMTRDTWARCTEMGVFSAVAVNQ